MNDRKMKWSESCENFLRWNLLKDNGILATMWSSCVTGEGSLVRSQVSCCIIFRFSSIFHANVMQSVKFCLHSRKPLTTSFPKFSRCRPYSTIWAKILLNKITANVLSLINCDARQILLRHKKIHLSLKWKINIKNFLWIFLRDFIFEQKKREIDIIENVGTAK